MIETSATYSADGRFVTSVTDSNLHTKTFVTNPLTGLVTSEEDEKGNTTNYTYNEQKQITSVVQDDMSIEYTYNNENQLSKIKQGEREYHFTYDEFLNRESVKIGNDITLATYKYDHNNGNLKEVLYGNGDKTSYQYDSFNRISTTQLPYGTYEYQYDNNGNLSKVSKIFYMNTFDTTGGTITLPQYSSVTKYRYDIGKRITDYTKDHFQIHYQYDSDDNVVSKNYHYNNCDYSATNTFDKDNQLTKMTLENTVVDYQYDDLGRLKNRIINSNYQSSYQYVSKGKRTSNLVKSITNGSDIYYYDYDELGNITKIYHNDILVNQYAYDNHNQLIEDIDHNKGEKTVYEYDHYGNMRTRNISDLETGVITKTDTYEYGNEKWSDQLTKWNDTVMEYDQIGNPTKIGDSNLLWLGRTLTKHETPGIEPGVERDIYYEYNQDGIRTHKRIERNVVQGDTTLHEIGYELEGNRIIYEHRDHRQVITYFYDLTGVIGLKYNEATYYYEKNIQGDIIGILDSNYNKVVCYEYDSWGKVLSVRDSEGNLITDPDHIGLINPFRYRSYYYDEETGWYYLNSRYYNPEWGRFINADNIIGANKDLLSYNLYIYVSNNFITYSDKSGHGIYSSLTKKEKENLLGNFSVSLIGYLAAMRATAKSKRIYGAEAERDSNTANAYRHAMWNAIMTHDMGYKNAKLIADAHEDGQTGADTEMDLFNNEIGRQIAIIYRDNYALYEMNLKQRHTACSFTFGLGWFCFDDTFEFEYLGKIYMINSKTDPYEMMSDMIEHSISKGVLVILEQ